MDTPRTYGRYGARAIRLEDLPEHPGPGSLTWRPVRRTLGIRAFGCNAYTAHTAGDDVVEPHTESESLGHEELYFVARGHARFTIDGDSFPAPAGTYVFVPDVRSHRHAVAEEAGTTVLSFGGPPTFDPSPWEIHWAASNEPDPHAGMALYEQALDSQPHSAAVRYNFACFVAAHQPARAMALLREAVTLEPALAARAATDPDLAPLHGDTGFAQLVATTPPAGA